MTGSTGSTGSNEAYLQQRQLRDIEDIRDELGRWLSNAAFGDEHRGAQLCVDKGLLEASRPLLAAIGFENKVVSCG